MRKHIYIILSFVSLVFPACRMQEMTLPEGSLMTFYATGETGTRTTLGLDGYTWGSILWSPADEIRIFYGDREGKFISTNNEKKADNVAFVGSLPEFELKEGQPFWAVYPYSEKTVFTGDAMEMELPAEQPAVAGNVKEGLLLSMARSQDKNLYFRNVCGFLTTGMPEEGIKKVVFKGNDGEPLAGRVRVSLDESGIPFVSEFINPVTEITLLPPDGETFKMDRNYYLVSFPCSFEKGYTVEFYRDALVTIKKNDVPVQLSRARLVQLGVNSGGIIYNREYNGKTYSVRYNTDWSSARYWVTIDGKEIPIPEKFTNTGLSPTLIGPAVAVDTETETVHFALARQNQREDLIDGVMYEISSSGSVRKEMYVGYYPYFRFDDTQQRLEFHSFSSPVDMEGNHRMYRIYYHDATCHSWVLREDEMIEDAASGRQTKQVSDALFLFHEPGPDTEPMAAVDLGLSVQWANRNLGASAPEYYGDYYAWGELSPKSEYSEWDYRFHSGDKYSAQDRKLQLDPEDDAARVQLGENWRIPTPEEWEELIDQCSWEWTTLNGVAGGKATSRINGKSIFLPATGYRFALGPEIQEMGLSGLYLSSRLYEDFFDCAKSYYGYPDGLYLRGSERWVGVSIRAVYVAPPVPVTEVRLDKNRVVLNVGENLSLTATVLPENATNKAVIWSSSDESVATVSSSGLVSAIREGTATISVTTEDGGKTATCQVTVPAEPKPIVMPEAIDLGLSVQWASWNLGAAVPEEAGNYYAWGEVETKQEYTWATYRYGSLSNKLTKYCVDPNWGTVDGRTVLERGDDVAATYLQGDWRMPTDAEFRELMDQCEWTWTSSDGRYGYLIKGLNGKSIFLPAGGSSDGKDGYGNPVFAYYWTSTIDPDSRCRPYYLYFSEASGVGLYNNGARFVGATVRPVYAAPFIHVERVSLDADSIEIFVGSSRSLHATVFPQNATNQEVNWFSSDEKIATVSGDGKVIGISEGTATITVKSVDGGKTATCQVKVKASSTITASEIVDMGLSVKWASCNLGASSPEEYGLFYAWGETEPKDHYYVNTYKWCAGTYHSMTKYCSDPEDGYNGFEDHKRVLDFEDDAAYVNLGAQWRTPTQQEWQELVNNCTWIWTTEFGIGGYKVTSNINGNQLFFPVGGYYLGNAIMSSEKGYYWSSSIGSSTSAFTPVFSVERTLMQYSAHRYLGQVIRPISPTPAARLTANPSRIVGKVGDRAVCFIDTVPENASRCFICSIRDESVATFLSPNGYLYNYGVVLDLIAPGTTTLTITSHDGGASVSCTIVVE